jgi:hypothetical protein
MAASPQEVHGLLLKYVNVLKGSQQRYFVLADGTLRYYKARGKVSTFRPIFLDSLL